MRLIFLIALACLDGVASAQTIVNNSLITPEKLIAYRGFENYLTIPDLQLDSNYTLISSRDTMHLYNDHFFYKARTSNTTDTLKLFCKDQYVKDFVFRIERLGRPDIYFGTVRDSVITMEELMENPGLVCSYEPALAKPGMRVRGFDASIIRRNGKEIPLYRIDISKTIDWSDEQWDNYYFEQYGSRKLNQFSKDQLKQIQKMKPGDVIWFKEAVVYRSDAKPNLVYLNLKLTLVASASQLNSKRRAQIQDQRRNRQN